MKLADALNHEYERLHVAKEDAFWTEKMGLADDPAAARAELDAREKDLARFLQDPERLAQVRAALPEAEGAARTALAGWERTFAANVIETAEARALAEEIIDLEGALANARGGMKLGYTDPATGAFVEASSVKLGTMLVTEKDEAKRKAAWEGLRAIETFVLEHGFLDVVKARNRLGKMLGAEDYYDWKVRRSEGMAKKDIFDLLDDLEAKTRAAGGRELDALAQEHGDAARRPWNLRYLTVGDTTTEQDPYFPFARALERWGKSFAALGIDYNGAEMVLDLVDRKGKYENGFMHGPQPAWRDGGAYRPARIHFTANAIPGMVGSGHRATETLFHEGGHAAHFANIDMPAPCFAQEFAPTSVAFAEVQSMFLDSLLGDADWQQRYARDADGSPMPPELIERGVRAQQAGAATGLRAMFTVPFCERAIYEIPDAELTADRVLDELRRLEARYTGLEEGSPRPTLSIPHLLAGEASAYYHGYVLALMGVAQTRRFFLERDGRLLDNDKIGPRLKEVYWRPGNSRRFPEFLEAMTGRPLSADDLAARAGRTPDEAVAEARAQLAAEPAIPRHDGAVDLGGTVRVVHGAETVATTERGFDPACADFARWIDAQVAP